MKKDFILGASVMLNLVLIIVVAIIWNTNYYYATCDVDGTCYTTQQKIGDYLLGRD